MIEHLEKISYALSELRKEKIAGFFVCIDENGEFTSIQNCNYQVVLELVIELLSLAKRKTKQKEKCLL